MRKKSRRKAILVLGLFLVQYSGCCLIPKESNNKPKPPQPSAVTEPLSGPYGVITVTTWRGAAHTTPYIDGKAVKRSYPKTGAFQPLPDFKESGRTYWKPGSHVVCAYCDVSKRDVCKSFELPEGKEVQIRILAKQTRNTKKTVGVRKDYYSTTTMTFPLTIEIYDPIDLSPPYPKK